MVVTPPTPSQFVWCDMIDLDQVEKNEDINAFIPNQWYWYDLQELDMDFTGMGIAPAFYQEITNVPDDPACMLHCPLGKVEEYFGFQKILYVYDTSVVSLGAYLLDYMGKQSLVFRDVKYLVTRGIQGRYRRVLCVCRFWSQLCSRAP